MKKIIILAFCTITILNSYSSSCQIKSFQLKLSFDTSTIKTLYVGKPYYMQMKSICEAFFEIDSANLINNTFTFKGTLSYPTLVRIYSLNDSANFSKLIFIDNGNQEIYINHDKNSVISKATSQVEKEHFIFCKELDIKTLDDNIDHDKLMSYVEKNPNSYVALYALINQPIQYYKYFADYNKILNLFSEEIKSTQSYKFFKNWYNPNLKIENYTVYNKGNKNVSLNFFNNNNKYTLLEFWFKGCSGCVEEFNLMKDLNTKDLSAKLNIIAISIDNKNRFKESSEYWKNSHYPWFNYWDWDGENIEKYSTLLYFPTNLLINSSGYIIGKDVDFSTIDQFLK